MAMTRRRVLMTLAGAATVGAAMAQKRLLETAPAMPPWIAPDWRRSLEAIGAAYVRQNRRRSGMAGRHLRTDTMTEALRHLGIPQHTAATLLASRRSPRFSACVRDDFEHGRTTEVDGWVLSTTEVAVAVVAWGEHGA
jgi:hypothetical protein